MNSPLSERVTIKWTVQQHRHGGPSFHASVGAVRVVTIHHCFLVSRGEDPYWSADWKLPQIKKSRLDADSREAAQSEAEGIIIMWLRNLGGGIEGGLSDG